MPLEKNNYGYDENRQDGAYVLIYIDYFSNSNKG